VAGAYRATPIRSLETETFTLPIDPYLDSQLAAFQKQLENSEDGQVTENSCNWVRARIRNRRRRKTARKSAIKEQTLTLTYKGICKIRIILENTEKSV
jgi:hypothetical protein